MLVNCGSLLKGCAEIDVMKHTHWGMSSPFCGNSQVIIKVLRKQCKMCMFLSNILSASTRL